MTHAELCERLRDIIQPDDEIVFFRQGHMTRVWWRRDTMRTDITPLVGLLLGRGAVGDLPNVNLWDVITALITAGCPLPHTLWQGVIRESGAMRVYRDGVARVWPPVRKLA